MTTRAAVREDWMRGGVTVRLSRRIIDGHVLRNMTGGPDLILKPEQLGPENMEPYTLLLSEDEARCIWEELNRHYGAHPVAQTDRADLLNERARVDKLTDAI